MRIALVSCGLSALSSWSDGKAADYGEVVAVNWACHFFDSDWVVAWDLVTWRVPGSKPPRKGIAYCGSLPDELASLVAERGLEFADIRPPLADNRVGACTLTFPNALKFCLDRWPESTIDVYGLDLRGRGINPDVGIYPPQREERERYFIELAMNGREGRVEFIGCEFQCRT